MELCKYCKSELKNGAIYCKECNHYQRTYRNWLPQLLVIAALIGSFWAYSLPSVKAWLKNVSWNVSLKVISFSSDAGVVLLNDGDGQIYVDSIKVKNSRGSRIVAKIVKKTIDEGKFLIYEKNPLKGRIVETGSEEEFKKLARREYSNIYPIYVSEEHLSLENYSEALGDRFRTLDCEATVIYYSPNSPGPISKRFPCKEYFIDVENLTNKVRLCE